MPTGDLKDWLLTIPELAPKLPQHLAGFFVKLHIPFDRPRGNVNVIQTIEPGKDDKHVPLVFDIDAFAEETFEIGEDAVWTRFDELREIKNRVFFDSITEKTKSLYL